VGHTVASLVTKDTAMASSGLRSTEVN